jgi:hypothetical protein
VRLGIDFIHPVGEGESGNAVLGGI